MLTLKKSKELRIFHVHLLKIILFVTFVYTFFKATASLFEIFPLSEYYRYTLFVYSFINLFSLWYLMKSNEHFMTSAKIATFASVINFSVMAYSSTYDEFRLAWFFFTSVAAFMFLGKKYGVFITLLIILIIVPMYNLDGMGFSKYAMTTFVSSMIIFAIFIYAFLNKIESDEKRFQSKIDEEVEKRQAQEMLLLRKQRMSNMGEMIDAIAHQWRQPLNQSNMLIMDIEDRLREENQLSDYVETQLDKLIKVTSHMSQTIGDFRHMLHENKEKTTFAVGNTIENVLTLMQSNLKGVEVIYSKSQGDEILGYKNELVQVLIILISNSIDALNEKNIENKKIWIEICNNVDTLSISVADNAGGIDTDVTSKVFDPYFTTKKQIDGTGLGLYMAKIMVEQNMLGKLTVANVKTNGHAGAVFTIKLKIGSGKE